MTRLSGSTRAACILGWPASHSLSPAIHNAAFAAAGLDWAYLAFEVSPQSLAAAIDGLRALGISGASVTMPHKQPVISLLDSVAPEARRAGAVNTIVNESGRLIGANTDGAGFLRFLEKDAGIDVSGRAVLLIGAGGAARSLAVSLGAAGAHVVVTARDPDAAAAVARLAGPVSATVSWDARDSKAAECALIVNATPIGQTDDASPLSQQAIPSGAAVVDLVYSPPATPLLAAAQAAGAEAHNGIGMLLHQAVLAFELWTGLPAPEEAMSAALVAAIGRAASQTATPPAP